MPKCPKCGKAASRTAFYCNDCGTLIREACPSCGTLVDVGMERCPRCGKPNRLYVS